MSEIRSSRIDYRSSRESLLPSGTFYTSRNQMHSSRVESSNTRHYGTRKSSSLELEQRDKKVKRRMRNVNEHIKDLEGIFDKFQNQFDDPEMFELLGNDDHFSDDIDHDYDGDDGGDSELSDLEPDDRVRTTEEPKNQPPELQSRSPYQGSGSNYRYQGPYISPDREENNLNSYLTNCNIISTNSEKASLETSKGHNSSCSNLYRHQYSSAYRNNPEASSRLKSGPKFESDRKAIVLSEESQVPSNSDYMMRTKLN